MKFIGLDAGSVSVKVVLLDEKGSRLYSSYKRHKGRPLDVALEMLRTVMRNELWAMSNEETNENPSRLTHNVSGPFSLSVTGSAGRLIGSILGIKTINEVVAHAYSTRKLYPFIRTIIELGGEDSKLIILGDDSFSAKDFSMNSVCAAGTGSFLDQQAERLRLSIEQFSILSLKSKKPPRIAGRCSVFAKSDMIHLQQIAAPVEDIVAGLCFAVVRNFKGSIARGRKLPHPVSFQGGVAANKGMIRAFREVFDIKELFVPEEYALMGATGAALKHMEETIGSRSEKQISFFDLQKLEDFINSIRSSEKGHKPLVDIGDDFLERHLKDRNELCVISNGLKNNKISKSNTSRITAFLGVDIGSISTNLAVIDENCRLLAKRYLMTAGRPIEAVRQGLEEIGKEIGSFVEIHGAGTTGSGRYMIADYIGADIVKNEITAQATAAAFIDKDVDTIFEIGGQDSKYISLKNGAIVDFEMNKACAAGTGSFLEEQAEKLDISIKNEFEKLALNSENPCRLGERCTVFMENSLMSSLQRGTDRKDLLAGLAYSIVQNYINRVVGKRRIGDKIFFQGGVASNKSVIAAFEKYLGRQVIVPPDHDVTGAIGMALLAKKNSEGSGVKSKELSKKNENPLPFTPHPSPLTAFKGFGLAGSRYEISSFECKGCPNVCEINKVKIQGEKNLLYYGGRCEKYDVRKKKTENKLPDLFAFRDEMLWKEHLKKTEEQKNRRAEATNVQASGLLSSGESPRRLNFLTSKLAIGIPFIFYFQDFLPFWTTLLWELGFDVEVSPPTNREITDAGLESVLAETCFPVKAAHGHIKYFFDKDIGAIFLPSFVNLNSPEDIFDRGFACPYTQAIPYMANIAFKEIKVLTPVINLSLGRAFLEKELKKVFKPYRISALKIKRALEKAENAQYEFKHTIETKGREILSGLNSRAVVITGRSYNSFDRGMNLNVPSKLADLGVLAIPMDFLPLEEFDISYDWPNMYWRSGQRILSAARMISSNPLLHAVYIGNFSCGPDSFIIRFFEEEMSGKPYLHLEIDAHSADAGVITRCEAFLDSIKDRNELCVTGNRLKHSKILPKHHSLPITLHQSRTVYIPRMSDHAFAISAAFQYCGLEADVLPEPSKESVDLGKKYVSGKECYPCAVTTGDMIKKINEPDFAPDKSAFFMPSGTGPCRFGQYNIFHRLILKELGLNNLPVLSPCQDEFFYQQLGILGKDFAIKSWEGIIAVSLLLKCLLETRPYENEKGTSDAVYERYLQRVYNSVRGSDGSITHTLGEAGKDFRNIAVNKDNRPVIGIVGEIFIRSNRFSNEGLIRKIEALGGEVCLSPVEEWISYINLMGLSKVLIKRDWSGMISLLLKRFFQKRVEHRFERHYAGDIRSLHEPDTRELLRNAKPYIHPSLEGEAILSIGKSIDLIKKGASGIINAMPFGCMPGTIVSGMMRGINNDFEIPCLSIPFDGTESLTTDIQLEAFMDQAKEYSKQVVSKKQLVLREQF